MGEAWCEHCELPASQCAHSPSARAVQQEADHQSSRASLRQSYPGVGPRIRASHESACEECGDRIFEGDMIVAVDGIWVHSDHHPETKSGPPQTDTSIFEGM